MIHHITPIKLSQSRDVKPRYAEPHETTTEDWGRPIAMDCSPEVRLTVSIDLMYDKEHHDLINDLIQTIYKIEKFAEQS